LKKGKNMANLSKRSTVYFDPAIHKILKVKAAETSTTISEIIDRAIRTELKEDAEDLQAFEDRLSEPTITYEKLIADLKRNGKI
jgi:hypothetical protein